MDPAVRRYDQRETRIRPQRPGQRAAENAAGRTSQVQQEQSGRAAALLPSMRSAAYSETNAPRPTKATDRHTTARESRTNDAVSSLPAARKPGRAGRPGPLRTQHGQAQRGVYHGLSSRSSGVSRRPPTATTAATVSGARAKPRLPPSENQPIAV